MRVAAGTALVLTNPAIAPVSRLKTSAAESVASPWRWNVISGCAATAIVRRSAGANERATAESAYRRIRSVAVTKFTPGCCWMKRMYFSKSAKAVSVSAAGRVLGFFQAARGGLAPRLKLTASQNSAWTHSEG